MLSDQMLSTAFHAIESGRLPTWLIRWGSRKLCGMQLKRELNKQTSEQQQVQLQTFLDSTLHAPIAPVPEKANEQHYELPPRFFELCLGDHRKYSGCYWTDHTKTLTEAEAEALSRSCEHAKLDDGMEILELGCGWGSLSLWMASHYPQSRITAVSNSAPQREFIESQAKERGLNNLKVITCDMNAFDTDQRFDRVVSIEMFEHMRNYQKLMKRVSEWLKPDGMLFVHIFTHRQLAYPYVAAGDEDFIAKHFFTGGIMPSDDFLLHFQDHMKIKRRWRWDGTHYEKTANAWLENMDQNKTEIMEIFNDVYGKADAKKWFHRWRVFYIACAELWGYENGKQWMVSHYLFEKRATVRRDSAPATPQPETIAAPTPQLAGQV